MGHGWQSFSHKLCYGEQQKETAAQREIKCALTSDAVIGTRKLATSTLNPFSGARQQGGARCPGIALSFPHWFRTGETVLRAPTPLSAVNTPQIQHMRATRRMGGIHNAVR
eukprot:531586-Rhodomonas_salina.1